MGVFFITLGAFPGGPGFLSWALNNASGPAIRAVSGAYVVTVGTAGGVLATWYVQSLSYSSAMADISYQDVRTKGRAKVPYWAHDQPCRPNRRVTALSRRDRLLQVGK